MSAPCPESGALEALRDGRLAAERAEALERHVESCAHCASEAGRMESLRTALVALPDPEVSPFRVAAGRRQLLEAAAAAGVRMDATSSRRWLAVASLVAVAAGVAVAWRWSGVSFPRGGTALATPSLHDASPNEQGLVLQVTPSQGARWSRLTSPAVETLTLLEGELGIVVDRQGTTRRLLVKVPDGEIEDVGTVFAVHVEGGRTRDVSVTLGGVVLRLKGRAERRLAAGEAFHDAAPVGTQDTPAASAVLAPERTPPAVPSRTRALA